MGVHTGKRKFMYVIIFFCLFEIIIRKEIDLKKTLVITYDKRQLTMCRRVKEQRCE